MLEEFSRTALLLGDDALNKLAEKRVAVFGIGGVGGYVCEALVRSGIGSFDLIDKDTVSTSNINRQIIALHSTVGRFKAEVMKERMLDINPNVRVIIHNCFFLPENADDFNFNDYDYVVDAVDTVTAKLEIITRAKKAGVPVISAMGAGNKLNPEGFKVADIYDTKVCPLAKVMRRELKKRNIDSLKVVYSEEEPLKVFVNDDDPDENKPRKATPGSIAFVPAVSGLVMASAIIKDLVK
ncbi:ThiF family adenylyltransferase [Lachnospiraceae bacterium C1.1]|nr:tRNA threonylcarbamoyladenosine dehydratase [Lachnospiraceae bacterium C1.1]